MHTQLEAAARCLIRLDPALASACDDGVITLLGSDVGAVHFRRHPARSGRLARTTPATSDELLQTFPERTGTLWWWRTGADTRFAVLLGLRCRTFFVPGFRV